VIAYIEQRQDHPPACRSFKHLPELALAPAQRTHILHTSHTNLADRKVEALRIDKICLFVETHLAQQIFWDSLRCVNVAWHDGGLFGRLVLPGLAGGLGFKGWAWVYWVIWGGVRVLDR
jgi:hypothetical protein